MLVYGNVARPIKRALNIPQAALAIFLVTLMMVVLAAAWQWWKSRRAAHWKAATTAAGTSPAPSGQPA